MQLAPVPTHSDYRDTVDETEIAKFSAMADAWWDAKGKFRPLHEITPLRIDYICNHVCAFMARDRRQSLPLDGLTILDIGCGGGLAAEPLSRLGADVTGIDASDKNIEVAKAHAAQSGLDIQYIAGRAETLCEQQKHYDVVLALEIIEHVADVDAFLRCIYDLTNDGGVIIVTTLNRTLKSLLTAKIGAEYVLRWLPVGTHDWNKFLQPSEIVMPLMQYGCKQRDLTGMVYHPFSRSWSLDKDDVSVNYLLCLQKA